MNHLEQSFKKKLIEIKTELENLDLHRLLETSTKYYQLENLITRIERRGVRAEKQREELSQFVQKTKEQFEEEKLIEIAISQIKVLDKKLEQFDYGIIKSSLISMIELADEFCNKNQIKNEDVNVFVFEDYSGYGNLLTYGFSGEGFPFNDTASRHDEILIGEIIEIDMTYCYERIEEIETKERKMPITPITYKLVEYADNVVHFVLSKSLSELYNNNWHDSLKRDSIYLNKLRFFHNHHDGIKKLIYTHK